MPSSNSSNSLYLKQDVRSDTRFPDLTTSVNSVFKHIKCNWIVLCIFALTIKSDNIKTTRGDTVLTNLGSLSPKEESIRQK